MKLTTKLLKKMIVEEINKLSEDQNEDMFDQGVRDVLGYEPHEVDAEYVGKQNLVDALMNNYGLSEKQAKEIIKTIQTTKNYADGPGDSIRYV